VSNINKLTSSEIGCLWTTCIRESAIMCFARYFFEKAEDNVIENIFQQSYELSYQRVNESARFLNSEDIPAPHGFDENDVYIDAPRLYTDSFLMHDMMQTSKMQFTSYSTFLSNSSRTDVRQFFSDCIKSSMVLYSKSVNILQSKGMYSRPDYTLIEEDASYVKEKGLIKDLFGHHRRLNIVEITRINSDIFSNNMVRTLITGFAQAAQSKQIRYYLSKGREISGKHIKILSSILQEEDIFPSLSWDIKPTASTAAPFSEKLMMFTISMLNAEGYTNYALSSAACMRDDLRNQYARMMSEMGMYAKECYKIMIGCPSPLTMKPLLRYRSPDAFICFFIPWY